MKTLLVPTDFSATAKHSAEYAYFMARQIKADLILCNAIYEIEELVPADDIELQSSDSNLSMEDSSNQQLAQLKIEIEKSGYKQGFKPVVHYLNETGLVTEVVNEVIKTMPIDMVVIGTHGTGGLETFLLGAHSRNMIDGMDKPLLLIPPAAHIGSIKRVAYATDFKQIENDLKSIYTLIDWFRPLNAEILLTHIYEEENHSKEFQQWIKQFMKEISDKANYPRIHYRVFKSEGIESGLAWLCEKGKIGILAMEHRSHTFIDSLFRKGQIHRTTNQLPIPLLVFPINII
jgi:nucleotide-binding universal stress UspA family protein